MNSLLEKLSSYNIFNYLLPGIIFVVVAKEFTHYSLIQQDIVVGIFLYYFVGLVISRFGSIIIEPFLRRVSYLNFADYKEFVAASQKDSKLDLLSEANNTYRTFCSLFALLFLLKLYDQIESRFPALKDWSLTIVVFALLVMFLFSYRKQTQYITKRIKAIG